MQLDGNGYDPVKAHQYYERTKKLKPRNKGSSRPTSSPSSTRTAVGTRVAAGPSKPQLSPKTQAAMAKVSRLKGKVSKLQGALSEARTALSKKRASAAKTEKKNSDGKTTAEERQNSKEYREKHQAEIASKRKKDDPSKASASKSVSDMGVEDLKARITKIQSALTEAKRQLSNASQQLGQLAHSDLTSGPMFNERFAHFHSAEGIPSK